MSTQTCLEATFAVFTKSQKDVFCYKVRSVCPTGSPAFITHSKSAELTRPAASSRMKQLMMTEPLSANATTLNNTGDGLLRIYALSITPEAWFSSLVLLLSSVRTMI